MPRLAASTEAATRRQAKLMRGAKRAEARARRLRTNKKAPTRRANRR